MSDSVIDGIWESAGYVGEPRIYDEEILFFDGNFLFIFRDLSAIPVGVESGTFELTEEGKLNVELDFDGMWNSDRTRDGWDNGGSTIGLELDLNDSSTVMVIDKELTLSKVEFSTSAPSVFGAWKVEGKDILAANDTYLLFLDDGVVVTATPIDQLGYSTYTGLEFGTYEYSSIEQRLTISYEYDGAILNSVDNGFSPLGNNFTIKSSGENYILTAEASGTSFSISNLFGTPSLEETELDTEALADGNYSLTLIVDLLGQVIFLSDLEEIIEGDSHKVLYQGQAYDYKDIDPFVTTVARNNEFTNEFSAEIAEQFPSQSDVTYAIALGLIGIANWESVLLSVAGADGNLVG